MPGISHFELTVRDLDRSLGFYRDLLGVRVALEGTTERVFPIAGRLRIYQQATREFRFAVLDPAAEPAAFGLSPVPTIVLLCPLGDPPTGEAIKVDQVGITHFGLWVDELDALHERLTGQGLVFLEPPHTMMTTPQGTVRSAFTQDPDRILVQLDEFVARPSPGS